VRDSGRFSGTWSNTPRVSALPLSELEKKPIEPPGYETPRQFVERRVPKASNIQEVINLSAFLTRLQLITSIGSDGFDRAAEIALTTEFAFRNAFLLCEDAAK